MGEGVFADGRFIFLICGLYWLGVIERCSSESAGTWDLGELGELSRRGSWTGEESNLVIDEGNMMVWCGGTIQLR